MAKDVGWADLTIAGVSKSFRDPRGAEVKALDGVNLDIPTGEFVVLLGPSGCGKTTLLRSIAGFEKIDAGSINLGGKRIDQLPPHKRPVNTVFQSYALFPHMSVAQNIAFGLENEKIEKNEVNSRVAQVLELVEMSALAERKPSQMSGGQQQRAALARALAKKPKVLLLDEPLAALDLKLRKSMQIELKRIHRATGTTFLFVTHDQNEAMALGDRIAVFSNGQLQQVGTPYEIYTAPKSEFVANFIGESTVLHGEVNKSSFNGDGLTIHELPDSIKESRNGKLIIRPEALSLITGTNNCGQAELKEVIFAGDALEVLLLTSTRCEVKVKSDVSLLAQLKIGDSYELFVDTHQIGQLA
ncbi:MAG: ABC transporter ATP-binding protein [Candidatus Planktophila sp.]|nr:ABC transporter ATP-binding protein [Candidatus Planktophila sp.]